MTLSILAFDQEQQIIGAAVTSCALAAGRRILHVRPGIGAAAAQASSEITWGEDILDLLAGGATPEAAIESFTRDANQVAAIDFTGTHAVHTGPGCEPFAGHSSGEAVVAQVNTAVLPDAPERMIEAYLHHDGPMPERLVAALAACGGDARGHQAAAVVVSGITPLRGYPDEPHVDLRVDDHRDPAAELQRLLALHRAHCTMRTVDRLADHERIPTIEGLVRAHPGDPHLERALHRLRSDAGGAVV